MVELVVFYFFGAVLVISASMVVTIRNPVFAALFLVLCFFSSAAIWLLMQAEFLAIALVLVYVGAVMVLFLFVVMMLDINIARIREGFVRFLPFGVIVALLMLIAISLIVGSGYFEMKMPAAPASAVSGYSNTTELGKALFSNYLYPFEVAGVILLVAIIAAISLTMRKPRSSKAQQPSLQVKVKKGERLKVLHVKAEPKQDQGG